MKELTKEQKRISWHYRRIAREHFFGKGGGKGWCLHHKDETLRERDIDRYIQWRIEDLVPMTMCEHSHHHDIGNKHNLGHHCSDETKRKISDRNTNHPKKSHVVSQYSKEGELISTFPSAKEASRQTGVGVSAITRCCKGNKSYVSAGGFVWRFGSEEKLDFVYDSGRKNNALSKRVNQLDKCGVAIRTFLSTKDAERITGISSCSISLCCNGHQKSAGGFVWRYA